MLDLRDPLLSMRVPHQPQVRRAVRSRGLLQVRLRSPGASEVPAVVPIGAQRHGMHEEDHRRHSQPSANLPHLLLRRHFEHADRLPGRSVAAVRQAAGMRSLHRRLLQQLGSRWTHRGRSSAVLRVGAHFVVSCAAAWDDCARQRSRGRFEFIG